MPLFLFRWHSTTSIAVISVYHTIAIVVLVVSFEKVANRKQLHKIPYSTIAVKRSLLLWWRSCVDTQLWCCSCSCRQLISSGLMMSAYGAFWLFLDFAVCTHHETVTFSRAGIVSGDRGNCSCVEIFCIIFFLQLYL